MPGSPRPFVAIRSFSCASQHYKIGDEVTHPIVLAAIASFRDQFVKATPAALKPSTPKTDDEGA